MSGGQRDRVERRAQADRLAADQRAERLAAPMAEGVVIQARRLPSRRHWADRTTPGPAARTSRPARACSVPGRTSRAPARATANSIGLAMCRPRLAEPKKSRDRSTVATPQPMSRSCARSPSASAPIAVRRPPPRRITRGKAARRGVGTWRDSPGAMRPARRRRTRRSGRVWSCACVVPAGNEPAFVAHELPAG